MKCPHTPDDRFWTSKNDELCPICMGAEMKTAHRLLSEIRDLLPLSKGLTLADQWVTDCNAWLEKQKS